MEGDCVCISLIEILIANKIPLQFHSSEILFNSMEIIEKDCL